MDNDRLLTEVIKNRKAFKLLEALCEKHIRLNSIGLKILGIHFMDNGKDWCVINHKHSFFEYHYVINGQVNTTLNGSTHKVISGESYVIPPGMNHAHEQKDGEGHIGIALRFEFINETVETNALMKQVSDASVPRVCNQKFREIFVELLNLTELHVSDIEMQLLVMRLIMNIGSTRSVEEDRMIKRDQGVHHQAITEQAIRFIEENYMEDILVEDVASSVYLSYSQLARMFKKYIGMTVNQSITHHRMEQAKLRLMNSDREIKSIAADVGFNSEHYFCNAFKSHVGVSASCYRANVKQRSPNDKTKNLP